jgi:hypothetical protein
MRAFPRFADQEADTLRVSRVLAAFAILSALACAHAGTATNASEEAAKESTEQPEAVQLEIEQPPQAIRATPSRVDKQRFFARIRAVLATSFCTDASFFRSCFDVTLEECREVMAEVGEACFAENEPDMPDFLLLPEDSPEFGKDGALFWKAVIGQCVGGAYEEKLSEKRISGGKCDDPSAWVP